ncbi:MAG TPA: TonB-dependent receptor [Candidatus Binatia bacterium]|nr:TonB-dependent receptor [Candidatus Binatia bacterium]
MTVTERTTTWGAAILFSRRIGVLLLSLIALGQPLVSAQSSSSTVQGIVEDSTGGAISRAQITLRSSSGRVVATTVSNSEGRFSISDISPGTYVLQAQSRGFEAVEKDVAVFPTSPIPTLLIALHVASVRESVNVSATGGYVATSAAAGTKVELPLMETPVAVQVIPQQVLRDQQTVNLVDALVNVSGVAPTNDSYGTSDSFSIRGFDANALLYQDGMKLDQYSASGFPQDMANVEEIQVVKGPASVLYGQSEPGGLVEVVTKKPHSDRFFNLDQQFGNHEFFRTTADLNQPLIKDRLLFRFVLDGTDANSFRNFVHTNQFAVYPSLTWRPSKLFDLTLQGSYATGSNILDNGIPFLADGTPAKVPRSSNFMDSGTNKSNISQYSFRPSMNIHLAENWSLRMQYKSETIDAPLPVDEYYLGDVDPDGNLQRGVFTETYFRHRSDQVLANLPGKFSLGPIKNTFLIGFDFYKQSGKWFGNTSITAAPINIYHPVYNQPLGPSDPTGDIFAVQGWTEYGAYVQDVAELPGKVFILAGVRLNWSELLENITTPDPYTFWPNDSHDRPNTPRFGLLWQPNTHVSLYGSYTSHYGDSALFVFTADGKPLPPQSANQTEFGIKTQWFDRRLTLSTAVYRIMKHNVPTTDPQNPFNTVAIGAARTQGVEFDISGQLTRTVRLVGGYSSLQALTTRDFNMPSLQGLPFPSIPHNAGSLWSVWEPQKSRLHGFRLGCGIQTRSGEQAYESADGVTYLADRVPSFVVANLMTGYEQTFGRTRIGAQVNINNLLDRTYFTTVNPSQAMPGAPFSIIPALQITF